MKQRLSAEIPAEDNALFDALLLMLGGDTLVTETVELIRQGQWAPGALRQSIHVHAQVFEGMEDVYLRERASDIRDLGRRILTHLQSDGRREIDYPSDTILVGEEVSAVQLAEVPPQCLVGVVSSTGSSSSHVAILARAMGVPAVMGVTDLPVSRMENRELIIDGYRGRVYPSPTPSVRSEYERLAEEERELTAGLRVCVACRRNRPTDRLPALPQHRPDQRDRQCESRGLRGHRAVSHRAAVHGARPIPGRVRAGDELPACTGGLLPRPVILRTLDIGGDKPLPYFPIVEQNPFLGWRGVRISLAHPEIFLTQVRAMLRAAVDLDNLQIMLPMISGVTEVDELKMLIKRAHDELLEEGHAVSMPNIGVMIECLLRST